MINTIVLTTNKRKSMKIVLKRRKHRKGIRPVRKGTLKTRMVNLPTGDEHRSRIDELWNIVMQDWGNKPRLNMTYSEMWAIQRRDAMKTAVLNQIKLMQKGFGFFREFKQMQFADLAESAILEFDALNSKIETPCNTCSLKNYSGCPFDTWKHVTNKADVCYKLREAPKPQVKTTTEMANLAQQHLS
jgi:hypothetical protein